MWSEECVEEISQLWFQAIQGLIEHGSRPGAGGGAPVPRADRLRRPDDLRPGRVTRRPGDPLYNAAANPTADDDFYCAGTYPIGFFDINSLAKFLDQNPDKKVTSVLMMYDNPAFAIASVAKTGINKPKDLEGKVLGAPPPDGAFAQWKAFVKENSIDDSKVKIEAIGFPVREPMLADGKVDAEIVINQIKKMGGNISPAVDGRITRKDAQ